MQKHNSYHFRPFIWGALAFALLTGVTLLALRVPTVSAHPARQATATAVAGTTFTNACGVVISNEIITPTATITATAVSAAATSTDTPPTAVPTVAPTSVMTSTEALSRTVQVLRIGENNYPAVLDPQRASFVNEFEILSLAYEGLVRVDAQGKVQPAAAEKYEFNADRSQLLLHLRPGLKRADGTALTANDFAAALRRTLDPCLGGRQYASTLYDIAGAQELSELDVDNSTPADLQKAQDAVGIDALDDQTLILSFNEPVGDQWLYIPSLPIFYPTDTKLAADHPNHWSEIAGNHNGNGPFVILTTDGAQYITLAANPNYWRGAPKLDRIEFSYNPDDRAQLEAYKKGELDINATVTAELVPQVLSDTVKSDFYQYDSAQTYALAFNNTLKPFNDRIVRVAFSQAVDRAGFIKDELGGTASATTRWMPKSVLGAQPNKPGVPASDAQAAVKTLVENGYGTPDGKVDCAKLGDLKFTYPDSPSNHARVEYVATNLEQVFGCKIAREPIDALTFSLLVRDVKTNPQLSLQRWVEDFPHPYNWLSAYWTCGSFAKRYGYCNLALDDLLHRADTTTNSAQALGLYQQAEDLMIQDVPGAFLYNPYNLQMVKPYVRGPQENKSPRDGGWIGQWGPVWDYSIDLNAVPDTYPTQ